MVRDAAACYMVSLEFGQLVMVLGGGLRLHIAELGLIALVEIAIALIAFPRRDVR